MGHRGRSVQRLLASGAAVLVLLGLALTAFALGDLAPTPAQTAIENWTPDGISQPIQVSADQVTTWTDGGQQIFLLQGGAVVTQGGNAIRAGDGAIWVDMARFSSERIYHVIVYGENPVDLDRAGAKTKAAFGYVRLATTGKIDIKAFKSKVAKEDRSIHPVYQRGLLSRPEGLVLPKAARPPIDPGIQPANWLQPAPAFPADPRLPGAPPGFDSIRTVAMQPEPNFPAVPGPVVNPVPDVAVSPVPAPIKPPPHISVRGRYFGDPNMKYQPLGNGLGVYIVTGGVTLIVNQPGGPGGKTSTLDMEADRAVIWTRDTGQSLFTNTRADQDIGGGAQDIYLSGHVELRSRSQKEVETLRADEVYYDVRRNVSVARKADLEIQSGKLPRSIHLTTDELQQLNPKLYKAKTVKIFSSLLPSDPGLAVNVDDLTIEEIQRERSYLFGRPGYDKEGNRIVDTKRYFTARNMTTELEGVPVFYLPYYRADVERPLGPLDGLSFGYNYVLGVQIMTTWDMFELLNLHRPEGSRWRLMLDYLTNRGPGIGTEYNFDSIDLFGIKNKYSGTIKLYGMFDHKADVLGGDRGNVIDWPDRFTHWPIDHPNFRGQAFANINVQELPEGFSVLGQLSFLRDRNFLEQFFLNTHLNELNQDTYLHVKQQQNNWAWTIEAQTNTQPWMTHTDWLPKADGYLIGQTFFDDWLVYNGHAGVGYGQLRPANAVPFAYLPTDVRANVFRADWMQEISAPFYLGPVKVAPYGVLDTALYTQDVNGDARGRLYGGGGIRWNLPLSRLYPDIQSELFNLNGIYHKINFVGNYYNVAVSSGVNNFPQLDRLNDDSTDQALRDFRPVQSLFNPANAAFLTTSNLFNPQNYAIRRLVDSNVDTLDNIEVLQLGINQRLQTKRGFPGQEHVIDWMTLNVGVSIFPHSQRDNFGHTFGILEYDWVWNIGDRTALTSSGWFEPFSGGPRAFDVGIYLGRPDTTNFTLLYRQIDPLDSKAVIAAITYPFSSKYAVQASTVWDFGNNIKSYSFFLSRMGTDLLINFGVSYNSTLNTFSAAFEILPNVVRAHRTAGLFPMAPLNVDPMINQR